MAKQRKKRRDEAALFVRLPREEAEKLDRFVFERRIPKRDVVRRLVAEHLDENDVMWRQPLPVAMPVPPEVVVGRADFVPTEAAEVMPIAEVAELLQAEPD